MDVRAESEKVKTFSECYTRMQEERGRNRGR